MCVTYGTRIIAVASRATRTALQALLDVIAQDEAATQAARDLLQPLTRYDCEHGGDLIHTLTVYFACSGNISKAAGRLFLHRNGLTYRLNRVEELLGVPLSDPDIALGLNLALRASSPTNAGS
jgi:DNA-binding PucR family transcriptional regulator